MNFAVLILALLPCVVIEQPTSNIVGFNLETHHTALLAERFGYDSEVVMPDETRCDLVNDEYAIEVEWAGKWKEAPAQSVLYSIWTGKKPAVFLLVKNWRESKADVLRCKMVCDKLGVRLVFIHVTYEPSAGSDRPPGG